ncbi:hypothetical protein BDW59DRAFT_73848 [Aspergillus cavernicola]|uniref:Uncharacterized protein n=1 Tax=Aspergillus cavernicola TaxID=176166 RepID=A0ABR4IC29_9EURO
MPVHFGLCTLQLCILVYLSILCHMTLKPLVICHFSLPPFARLGTFVLKLPSLLFSNIDFCFSCIPLPFYFSSHSMSSLIR